MLHAPVQLSAVMTWGVTNKFLIFTYASTIGKYAR